MKKISEVARFWIDSCLKIRDCGCVNAFHCKISIPSPWNLDLFEELLKGYHDQQLVPFLWFGWPIETSDVAHLDKKLLNQKGARDNLDRLRAYVREEVDRGAVIGPFAKNPLGKGARFSPLDAIPKKDSEELCIIMNLSYPVGGPSVNAAIDKNNYMGSPTDLTYPNILDLVKLVKCKGMGCLLFKRDLWKCYRQVFMDLQSILLLGFSVEGELYFDVILFCVVMVDHLHITSFR